MWLYIVCLIGGFALSFILLKLFKVGEAPKLPPEDIKPIGEKVHKAHKVHREEIDIEELPKYEPMKVKHMKKQSKPLKYNKYKTVNKRK